MGKYIYEIVHVGRTDYLDFTEVKERFVITGYNFNPRTRKELQGSPKLDGYLGAMWGGYKDDKPVLRYETQEVYDILSK